MRFDGFYGNEETKRILSGVFDSRRIPNCILIEGPDGAGKKTLARIIASAAVCESNGELPCGKCRQCRNALSGNHPDITFYAKANNADFNIKTVRNMRLDAYVKPNDAKRKVYILANIQDISDQAQNALLKIIEEPPEFVLFIITCDSRSHVLETVRSRAQTVTVGSVSESDAVRALTQQCKGADADAVLRAVRISGGIIGRAKLMLDSGFSKVSEFTDDFTKKLCASNIYEFLRLSGILQKDKELNAAFLNILPMLIRDAISLRLGGAANLSGFAEDAGLLAKKTAFEKLCKAEVTALESKRAAECSANITLRLTAMFSQLWSCLHG